MSIFKEDISIYINIYTMYHKNTHFYSNFIWVGVVRERIEYHWRKVKITNNHCKYFGSYKKRLLLVSLVVKKTKKHKK